jgi:phosphoribosylformylglycinamidine (FGAM) synthase PurS component
MNKDLNKHKGELVERHSQHMSFENIIDVKIMQKLKFKVSANRENQIQINLDIFNVHQHTQQRPRSKTFFY